MNECTTCKNHSPMMSLDDIPSVCYPCVHAGMKTGYYPNYDPDLGKLLTRKLEESITEGNQIVASPEAEQALQTALGLPRKNVVITKGTKAMDVQVGGEHYKSLAIQPITYITENNLGYCEANVVKYITRWRDKGGKKDLEKAKHYIDLLIEMEGL